MSAQAYEVAPGARVVAVHLTSFALGCEHFHVGDDRRWLAFVGPKPLGLVLAMAERLGTPPEAITVERQANGDLALMAPAPPNAREMADPDGRAPLAFICTGLSEPELRQALSDLRQQGRPS